MRAIPFLLPLAACAATPPMGGPVAIEQESIRYETAPCFGACPVYAVTVRPDGTGTFEGQRFTAVTGPRAFALDPVTYRRFAAALAPYRPASGDLRYAPGEANCGNAPTDMPSASVTWHSNTGAAPQTLSFYYGCRGGGAEALAATLRRAPELLPIADLIGPPQTGR